jgi:hypothetical protein
VAIEVIIGVVNGGGGAEHSRIPGTRGGVGLLVPGPRQQGKSRTLTPRDWIPNHEGIIPVLPLMVPAHAVEEDAAMACVDRPVVEAGGGRAEEGAGDVAGPWPAAAEEAEYRGRPVELTEPAAESGVGDDAAPALADERGVEEVRGVVRWNAEEDLLHELVHQRRRLRRPRRHAARRRSDRIGARVSTGPVRVEWSQWDI